MSESGADSAHTTDSPKIRPLSAQFDSLRTPATIQSAFAFRQIAEPCKLPEIPAFASEFKHWHPIRSRFQHLELFAKVKELIRIFRTGLHIKSRIKGFFANQLKMANHFKVANQLDESNQFKLRIIASRTLVKAIHPMTAIKPLQAQHKPIEVAT